jgi:hypothetical protein
MWLLLAVFAVAALIDHSYYLATMFVLTSLFYALTRLS